MDSPSPLLSTTYAHAPYGLRADYSLSFSKTVVGDRLLPTPRPKYAVGRPLFANTSYELWRLRVPSGVPATASRRLIEP